MDKGTITSVSDMITDTVEEIEYMIQISNEQWRRDREKLKAANTEYQPHHGQSGPDDQARIIFSPPWSMLGRDQ